MTPNNLKTPPPPKKSGKPLPNNNNNNKNSAGMTKVYPNSLTPLDITAEGAKEEEVLTVWRKSLLFNCYGFTVFDGRGHLCYRVDSYSSRRSPEILLMDASGNSVFTIRRKRLSLGENWVVYNGDEVVEPLFSVKKNPALALLGKYSKPLAEVTPCRRSRSFCSPCSYAIEGSYVKRKCTIYDNMRRAVAEVGRKESAAGVSLGGDVFRLVVRPGLDVSLAMAMVIALEQIYRS